MRQHSHDKKGQKHGNGPDVEQRAVGLPFPHDVSRYAHGDGEAEKRSKLQLAQII